MTIVFRLMKITSGSCSYHNLPLNYCCVIIEKIKGHLIGIPNSWSSFYCKERIRFHRLHNFEQYVRNDTLIHMTLIPCRRHLVEEVEDSLVLYYNNISVFQKCNRFRCFNYLITLGHQDKNLIFSMSKSTKIPFLSEMLSCIIVDPIPHTTWTQCH